MEGKVFFRGEILKPLEYCSTKKAKEDSLDKIMLNNENGEEVGYILYGIWSNRCEIRYLYVVEKYRCTALSHYGYGKELMRLVLSIENIKEVHLYPKASPKLGEKNYLKDDDLRAFYKSFCFDGEGKTIILNT